MKVNVLLKKIVIFCGLFFLFTTPCYPQSSDTGGKRFNKYNIQPRQSFYTFTPKLVDEYDEKTPSGNDVVVYVYDLNWSKVKLFEEYFKNTEELEKRLTEKLSQWKSCSDGKPLKTTEKGVTGKIYICESEVKGGKNTVLSYTFIEGIYKITDISADNIETVEDFAKNIYPIACHIYGTGCTDIYDANKEIKPVVN